jgi:hypothetical protein
MTVDALRLREKLLTEFTPSAIEAGQRFLTHYHEHIRDTVQEVHVLRHLLREVREAHQAIDHKLMTISFLAGEGHVPGEPQGELESGGGNGLGFYQVYQNGAIFWRRDLGAWWVQGAIWIKYRALNASAGILGYPLTDEGKATDGSGRFTHFERGSIYWHPAIGEAFEVHGDIRAKWQVLGSEAWGYPTTDERKCGNGEGRFNHFRAIRTDATTADGSIYWTFETKAQAIYGAIRERWKALGWERSYLGYPVTSEMPWTDPETVKSGRISHFQRGALGWTAEDGRVTEHPERIVLNSGHIGVSSIGGWVELVLTSVGTFHFRGHLHNSGLVGLKCVVAAAVKINGTDIGLAAKKEVNVGGTASFDDRDEDWEETGYTDPIRRHWDALRSGSALTTVIDADLAAADALLLVVLPLFGLVTLIGLSGGVPPESQRCKTSGWHTVKDGNNNTTAEPGGVRCFPEP